MSFTADLHIHSRFSRATSRKLTPRNLVAWGMVKGLNVLGTGDFTHPAWRAELAEALERDEESGLYTLKESPCLEEALPELERLDARPPLFLWQAEISSIYKRHGKVRRVHNLVYMPDLDAAERFSTRLESIGNLASDGRPILGLDSRNLLEMVLETDPRGVLIPAHAWTPWFAIFGSKSGFDSLEECFGDLAHEVFALETGLSSDPDMNRLWSHLDRMALISNSDAHSGENLGREVNRFSGAPSYDGIFNALRNPGATDAACAYAGTVEFFPEEGKYHLDGHRACNVVMEPREALAHGNICPVCGKPLTIGVLHRVLELADRTEPLPPEQLGAGFTSLIPLPELLGELVGCAPKSRKVMAQYAKVLQTFGPELEILHSVEIDALRRHWEALGEGIARMRRGEVIREGGFDGEYGTVRVFTPQEAAELRGGRSSLLPGFKPASRAKAEKKAPAKKTSPAELPLLAGAMPSTPSAEAAPLSTSSAVPAPSPAPASTVLENPDSDSGASELLREFSPQQRQAILAGLETPEHPVLVAAGPGAGKTRTLVGRVLQLRERGVASSQMLVLTFTRRAAAELKERLGAHLSPDALPDCDTLHALAFQRISQEGETPPVLLSEEGSRRIFAEANPDVDAAARRAAWDALQLARERRTSPPADLAACLGRYGARKAELRVLDYTDLLERWLRRMQAAPETSPWKYVLADEVQDLSPLQWAVLRGLLPEDGAGFFGIGDPDQAIYGFRGAQEDMPGTLRGWWPGLEVLGLAQSYRAVSGVLECASTLLAGHAQCGVLSSRRSGPATLHLFSAPTVEAEAHWVATQIRQLLGATSHTLTDAARRKGAPRRTGHLENASCAPGDIAVLVRLKAQVGPLRQALERQGVPCAVPEQEGCWHDAGVALLLAEAERRASADPHIPEEHEALAACEESVWERGPSALPTVLLQVAPLDALFWKSAAFKELSKLWAAEKSWPALLARIRFMQDQEQVRAGAERVQIMTLHASKGLEFRCVFLPGLEDGLLPLQRERLFAKADAVGDPRSEAQALEEERRLLYVGITRAAEAVFASHAAQRLLYGVTLQLPPSRFLPTLRRHFSASALVRHTEVKRTQLTLL